MSTFKQWIKFAVVGTIGVGVNAIFFTIFSAFSPFQFAPLAFLGFSEINLAWGIGILFAMTSNFFLSKIWVFSKSEKKPKPKYYEITCPTHGKLLFHVSGFYPQAVYCPVKGCHFWRLV